MKFKKRFTFLNAVIFIFIINIPYMAFARAGGHSRGGHISGGSHHTNSIGGSSHTSNNIFYSDNNFISLIINIIILAIIIYTVKNIFTKPSSAYLREKKSKTKEKLNNLKNSNIIWDLNNINNRFELCFFSIQNAWKKRDFNLSKDFCDESIYKSFNHKLKKMIKNHEINIMRNIRIDEYYPISVILKRGTKKRSSLIEIWTFISINDKWVLKKIKQYK